MHGFPFLFQDIIKLKTWAPLIDVIVQLIFYNLVSHPQNTDLVIFTKKCINVFYKIFQKAEFRRILYHIASKQKLFCLILFCFKSPISERSGS